MLLHTEYSLLSLLHTQDGVVHHHGLFQVRAPTLLVLPSICQSCGSHGPTCDSQYSSPAACAGLGRGLWSYARAMLAATVFRGGLNLQDCSQMTTVAARRAWKCCFSVGEKAKHLLSPPAMFLIGWA